MKPACYVRDIGILYEFFVWSLRQLLELCRCMYYLMGTTHHFPSAKTLAHVAINLNLIDKACHACGTTDRAQEEN